MPKTDVLIIGAGQCGLALSRELGLRGVEHAVLDAHESPGDQWRERWDSLRLFTPARFDALSGRRAFPAGARVCPTAREFATYLEQYADEFSVPLHTGVSVDEVAANTGPGFTVSARGVEGTQTWEAARVVVATGGHTAPKIPTVSKSIDPHISQMHTSEYRRPSDIAGNRVLIVGAGTSGVQLGIELAEAGRDVVVAGRPTQSIPAPLLAVAGGLWFALLHRVLTRSTPMGRKAAPSVVSKGAPLIGISARDLERAGARLAPRLSVTIDGVPRLDDGQVLEVDAVLWATGYGPSLDWVRGLTLDSNGIPLNDRGVSTTIPGLSFLGLPFQYGLTSTLIGGAGRDAAYLADTLTHDHQVNASANT